MAWTVRVTSFGTGPYTLEDPDRVSFGENPQTRLSLACGTGMREPELCSIQSDGLSYQGSAASDAKLVGPGISLAMESDDFAISSPGTPEQ
ncbi:hypothetical protein T265_14786, partial [Opisthorchis viverrini]